MQVSPDQAQFLAMLVQIMGAERCIEVGVFHGYSSLAVALVLPEWGRLVACERDESCLNIARRYYERAGVTHKVDVRHGLAMDSLQYLLDNGEGGSYDFAFLDADKRMYHQYYEMLLQLMQGIGSCGQHLVVWENSKPLGGRQEDTVSSGFQSVSSVR
jgi:predicted O-methyltransferase YrrM